MHSHLSVICFFKERIELYSTIFKSQLKLSKISTNCVILSASFSSPRQQRRTELYASQQNQSTPNSKKLQNFCNRLYLNNFKFIKFYTLTRYTESSKNSPTTLLLFATFRCYFSLYCWRFGPIYSYNLHFLQ